MFLILAIKINKRIFSTSNTVDCGNKKGKLSRPLFSQESTQFVPEWPWIFLLRMFQESVLDFRVDDTMVRQSILAP